MLRTEMHNRVTVECPLVFAIHTCMQAQTHRNIKKPSPLFGFQAMWDREIFQGLQEVKATFKRSTRPKNRQHGEERWMTENTQVQTVATFSLNGCL